MSEFSQELARKMFVFFLVLIILPSGSISETALHISAIYMGVLALAPQNDILANSGWLRVVPNFCMSIGVFLAIWAILQSGLLGSPLGENHIWSKVRDIYGVARTSISVMPGDTLSGIVPLVLPFLTMNFVMRAFNTDKLSIGFIRSAVLCAFTVNLFALTQYLYFSDWILFSHKEFYKDSFTSVFVNRNTAASYISINMMFSIGVCFHELSKIGFGGLGSALADLEHHDGLIFRRLHGVMYALISIILCYMLILTNSRAGIISTLIGVFVFIFGILIKNQFFKLARSVSAVSKLQLVRIAIISMGLILFVVLVFGGMLEKTAFRAGAQEARDLRFCHFSALQKMASENWVLGTGLSTFREAFPAYRKGACGLNGVLHRAHNFYLEGVICLGLPFIASLIISVSILIFCFVRGFSKRSQLYWVPLIGFCAFLSQALHSLVDFSMQNPGIGVFFSSLMGASLVVSLNSSLRVK